ncbi:MAG: U32 family peptidase [Coriobacteriia bacterium]|nr:U32 family peptidase [Coriobacteriia bacterium]
MKFIAPVHNAAEVALLVQAGADELYCGYQDPAWRELYGNHDSISRRQGAANVDDMRDFKQLIAEARRLDVPLYLTMNGRYTEPQLDALARLCFRFEELGGTGLQIFDLGLLARLAGHTQLRRCLSLLAVAQNAATLQAYQELGVDRVVFPRFLRPPQIAELLDAVPGLEGEFMALFDKCRFIDGYCRFYHGNAYEDAPKTEQSAANPGLCAGCSNSVLPLPDPEADQQIDAVYSFDTNYQTHSCIQLLGAPVNNFACAACALGVFESAGAHFAKLGGRGTPLKQRVCGLLFLHTAQHCASDEERQEFYHATFSADCHCYYPTCGAPA